MHLHMSKCVVLEARVGGCIFGVFFAVCVLLQYTYVCVGLCAHEVCVVILAGCVLY